MDENNIFDELLTPANEKLETNLLDHTLAKTMKLYHGTQKEDLKTISPTSWNMGTRLSPKARKSSFWTKDFDYAVIWSLDWVAMRYNAPFFHDIKGRKFVVPDWSVERKSDGKEFPLDEFLLMSLKEHPVYVYEAEVPVKHIGRGQLPIDEYTVDVPITPTKKTVITPEIARKYINWTRDEVFTKYHSANYGVYSKSKTNLLEKIVFKNGVKVMKQRAAMYDKEKTKENATESFIDWCDNMMIAEESLGFGKKKNDDKEKQNDHVEKFKSTDGKNREINWCDKYKTDKEARNSVRSYVTGQINMIIKNEQHLLDIIYQKKDDIDDPSERENDYFDYFEIIEGSDTNVPLVIPYTAYNQMYLKNAVNGKASIKDVDYND